MPMSDSDYHSMPPTEEREGGIGCIPVTLCALVGLAMIYMAGLGCFFRWEEKAPTQAEFMRRSHMRGTVYAPVGWLTAHDSTGAIWAMVQWEYRLCHKKSFDLDRLP
jgi:hypothetical protein